MFVYLSDTLLSSPPPSPSFGRFIAQTSFRGFRTMSSETFPSTPPTTLSEQLATGLQSEPGGHVNTSGHNFDFVV